MSKRRDSDVETYVPVHLRRRRKVARVRGRGSGSQEGGVGNEGADVQESVFQGPSLLDMTLEKRDPLATADDLAAEAIAQEEAEIMEAVTSFKPLISASEHAQGVSYSQALETSWKPCSWMMKLTEKFGEAVWDKVREKKLIKVEGDRVPPPALRFQDMKLPRGLMQFLQGKGIVTPSPIQMQGLPTILSGRDTIGVAFTGSGKTLVFTMPIVAMALSVELGRPIRPGEGPIGLILCPSRELASQTYDVCKEMADALRQDGAPQLHCALSIGGISMREQMQMMRDGVHIIVATPGRLLHQLNEQKLNLELCQYLCFDEADRMIDLGFEEPIRDIMSYFRGQRQTVLFSATMPLTISQFAKSALVDPVLVNVGRAGAANRNVRQVVRYVEQDEKLQRLLDVIEPIPPPVIIFADNQRDCDDIMQYLVLKGLNVCAIHGGLRQEERQAAIASFKDLSKDILVSTDIGAKGLDFPGIAHVINFDMPREIENYVHRIGRTGRGGAKGVATTFVNRNCDETLLLDLRQLLLEGKQDVPQFLMDMAPLNVEGGCSYCGGLGHRLLDCPKLEGERRKALGAASSAAMGGAY